jgi:hypothetical protein
MNKDYITHWIVGIICALVWFWGAQVGIPASAISLAAWIVPGLLAHAVGTSSVNGSKAPDPAPTDTPAPPAA